MTPEQFAAQMKKIEANGDCEDRHLNADDLMCEVLASLGYSEGVEIFKKMPKWYA